MKEDAISPNRAIELIVLVMASDSILSGAFTIKQDGWIMLIIACIFFLPLIFIYSRISSLYPGKGLFDIFDEVFGKIGGSILTLIAVFYVFSDASLTLRLYVDYTSVISLQDTPVVPICILIMTTVIYLASKGISVFEKWIALIAVVIIASIGLTIVAAVNVMDTSNIFPIFEHSFAELSKNATALFSNPFGDTIYVLALLDSVKFKSKKTPYKIMFLGTIFGSILLVLTALRNILILGPEMLIASKYVSFQASRIIQVGKFIERFESVISFNLLLLGITKLVFVITVTAKGVAKLMKTNDYRRFLFPLGLLCMALASIMFKTTYEMLEFYKISKYLTFPFIFVIPILLWITAEIKKKRLKN